MLTVVVATTIAGYVAESRPRSYTATMVFLVMPTRSGDISPDGAKRLANTYAALVLDDALITRAVAGAVQREPAEVKARLTGDNPANTALVRVTYAGRTTTEALTAMRALEDAVTGPHPASPAVRPRALITVQAAQIKG